MSNLTIKEVKHEEEHPVCEKCSAKMTEIGEEKVYDEFVYVPGEFYVRRHIVKNTSVRNVVRTLRKMVTADQTSGQKNEPRSTSAQIPYSVHHNELQ